jgi:hypothetical protein
MSWSWLSFGVGFASGIIAVIGAVFCGAMYQLFRWNE